MIQALNLSNHLGSKATVINILHCEKYSWLKLIDIIKQIEYIKD